MWCRGLLQPPGPGRRLAVAELRYRDSVRAARVAVAAGQAVVRDVDDPGREDVRKVALQHGVRGERLAAVGAGHRRGHLRGRQHARDVQEALDCAIP